MKKTKKLLTKGLPLLLCSAILIGGLPTAVLADTNEGENISTIATTSAPTVNPVYNSDTQISGIATAKSRILVFAKERLIAVGIADSDGNYSLTIPRQSYGTSLSVTAKAYDEKASLPTTIEVDAHKTANPIVNPITASDDTVTGTAPANSSVRIKIGNQLIGLTIADSSGNFTAKIIPQVAGTILLVEAKNLEDYPSDGVSLIVMPLVTE